MRRSHHVDHRGNTIERRKRREWMLSNPAFGGTGKTLLCYHCKRRIKRFDVDRFPVCGHMGGRYYRNNIVPACLRCNRASVHGRKGCIRHRGLDWKLVLKQPTHGA